MENIVGLGCLWTVKERVILPISHKEIWHPVLTRKNTFTITGLTSLASAISGNYIPPLYLILASNYSIVEVTTAVADTSITLAAQVDQAGDTQLSLSIGLANQEVVTFTSVTLNIDSTATYALAAPMTYAHTSGEQVTRQPVTTDTMNNILGEFQYDPTNSPGTRATSIAGYSGGAGNWITQFYFVLGLANAYISDIGLTENPSIGSGTLHNHVVLGYDHSTSTTDIEIDGSLTLINL